LSDIAKSGSVIKSGPDFSLEIVLVAEALSIPGSLLANPFWLEDEAIEFDVVEIPVADLVRCFCSCHPQACPESEKIKTRTEQRALCVCINRAAVKKTTKQ
jgi:myo-inositol catabolism protein IolC